MRFSLFAAAAAGLCSLLLPIAARADIAGDTFDVSYRFPIQTTVFKNIGDFTVPSAGGVPGNPAFFTLAPNQIALYITGPAQLYSAEFSGLEFDDLTKDPMIIGASLDTTVSTLFDAVVTFTSNSVALNLQSLGQVSAGDDAVINLTFAPPNSVTPEPSSIALLGTGMLGVAGVVRRRYQA